MRRNRVMALILTSVMIAGSFTGCGTEAETPEENTVAEMTDEDKLVNAMSAVSSVGAEMAQKQETVYVKTNASGGVDSVVVSNWLTNSDNAGELLDSSDLTDIKNLKGKQGYSEENGQMVWDASGEDIYYQGTTDKALPVDVKISYKLDGKPISPEELAGKQGHVEICMNYTNHDTQKVEIGGEEETIYTPFAVMSGMILDEEKFTNVSVTNGTVISDGNKDIVVGMAFPGLIDSLNGQKVSDDELLGKIEEQIRIPSEITVDADTSDFELGMTMTMVSSDVMGALGLDSMAPKNMQIPDLRASMEEFKNAGGELVSGTGQLRNGAGELSDGAAQLSDGTGDLYDGVVKYTDGVGQLSSGALQLNDGAGKLDNGVGTLQSGIEKVDAGAGALSDGIGSATDGADQVKDGVGQVNAGAAGLKDGAARVSAGIKGLQSQMGSLSQLKDGLGQAAAGAAQIRDGLNALAGQISGAAFSTVNGVDGVSAEGISVPEASTVSNVGYVSVSVSTDGLPEEAVGAVEAAVAEAEAQANAQIDAANGQIDAANATIGSLASALDGANGQISAAADAANAQIAAANGQIDTANAQIGAAQGILQAASATLQQLAGAAGSLADSLTAMENALDVDALSAGISQLSAGASSVADGASQLSAGTEKLNGGASTLSNGLHSLLSGATELKSGTARLADGASELKSGSAQLVNGTGQLVNGTLELNSNSAALIDGAGRVADGAGQLADGAGQLYAGVQKLDDGMVRFDAEGIQKLTDLFDTDLDSMEQRIKAISDAGKAYKSFGGSSEDEEGSVRFVIESAPVKAEPAKAEPAGTEQ